MRVLLLLLLSGVAAAQIPSPTPGGGGGGSSFITSLTTTGTSGPSTVSSGVLNIPQYTGGGGTTTNPATFNNGGAGAASGTTFDGSVARTISYNTLGASPLAGSASLVTVGTLTGGATGAGFTVALTTSTVTGNLPLANLTGGAPGAADTTYVSTSTSAAAWKAIGSCSGATNALTYNTTTHAFGCNTITAGSIASTSNLLAGDGAGNGVSSGIASSNVPLLNASLNTYSGALALTGQMPAGTRASTAAQDYYSVDGVGRMFAYGPNTSTAAGFEVVTVSSDASVFRLSMLVDASTATVGFGCSGAGAIIANCPTRTTTAGALTAASINATSGGITSASDGTHAGAVGLVGNTTVPVSLGTNNANIIGPNSASFTSYGLQLPATIAAGILHVGTPSSNIAQITSSAIVGSDMTNNTVTATQLAAQYSKGTCTEAWGGSGSSFALTAGDDAVVNNTCYNDSGVTRTITAVKCRSSSGSNTTTVNPTFGSAGTGTTILSGALTCGSSYAYSSSGTVSNASWTTGTGITPAMGGTLTGTSIAMIVEYTY